MQAEGLRKDWNCAIGALISFTHGKLVVKKTDLIFHHITANGTRRVRQPTNSFHKKKYNLACTKSLPSCKKILRK
jgi:hypothetical protein